MANNKTETTLAYRVDARGLQEARRQFVATFKTDILKTYNKEALNVSKTIGALANAQKALNNETKKVKDAVTAYQQLGKAVGSVATAYGRMQTSAKGAYGVGGLTPNKGFSASAYAAPQGPAPPPRMGAGVRGFMQGLAPGMGQFLDADTTPEARRQLAGQWAGYGIRRAAGAGVNAVSGMLAGQGPLSTMFGNIPFIGGAASQAEAMSGSALANYQARLTAFPFLGKDVGGAGHWSGGAKAAASGPGLVGSPNIESNAAYERRAARNRSLVEGTQGTSISLNPFSTLANAGAESESNRIAREGAESALAHGARRGQAATTTPTGSRAKWTAGTGYAGVGGKIGLDETASIQMAGQLGSQIGGAGAMSPDRFAQMLGAQTMGVDTGASAGLLRQMQPGRGGSGDNNTLAKTIGDAVSMGMANSEIGEYLENISNLQEQAAQRGVRISTEGFSNLVGAIAGTGIGGLQGARIAGGFQNAAMNTANTGVKGPADVQLARAYGYDPKKPGSYITALKRMEENPMSPEVLKNFVGRISAGTSGDQKELTIKRALGTLGISTSFAQAGQLGAGNFSGMPSLPGAPKTAGDLSGRLDSGDIKGLAGALSAQAGIQNQLLASGKNMLPVVQELQKSAANLSTAISTFGPQLKSYIADPITALSAEIKDLLLSIHKFPGMG